MRRNDTVLRTGSGATFLSLGFQVEAFVSTQQQVPYFSDKPSRRDYEELVARVACGLEDDGHVIAVYPAWSSEPALQRLETVRTSLQTSRLVCYPTALPPLAGAVLVSLASAVAPYIEAPGSLLAALPALERELVVLAWLGSVANLLHPSPSVVQHLASWWPASAFGVSFWPEPSVKRLTKADGVVTVPTSHRPMLLAASAHDADPSWIESVVAPALGSPPLKKVPATPLGPRWWGTSKLVEAVAYPIDVPVTARRITQHQELFACRWCGESIASPRCPFCRLETSRAPLGGAA